MARKFLTHLDLAKNELQNGVIQNLGSAPGSPVKGQIYFNSSDNTLYWHDGTAWVSSRGGGTGFPGFGAVTPQTSSGAASADGVGTTTSRTDHQHGTPTHTSADHGGIPLNSFAQPTGPVDFASQKLTQVGTPTNGTDGANKSYVDNAIGGLSWKEAVRVATTATVTISSALNNGDVIDGVTLVTGDRVLVKNQTATAENGIYVVAASPARAADLDQATDFEQATVFVMEGTTHADQAWTLTTNAPITVGTTGLTWAQFGAGTAYTAGAGLTLTASTLDVGAGTGITVAADSVAVSYGGDGAASTSSRSDHTHAAYAAVEHDSAHDDRFSLLAHTHAAHADSDHDDRFSLLAHTHTGGPLRYAVSVGGSTTATVTHNLGTRDVAVTVYRVASPYDTVECDMERTDTNTVTLRFTVAPAASEYRCVVLG